MDRVYAEFIGGLGLTMQRSPIPEMSMFVEFSIVPGNVEDTEKKLKEQLLTLKEALMATAVVVYPELIVYPQIGGQYYLFRFEVKFA
jgi:hypothetical protein